MRAAGVHNGQALLFVDTGAVARRVEQLPWVEHARVRRDFPGTVSIAVTEYVPAAYVRVTGGKLALVASSGRVIGALEDGAARTRSRCAACARSRWWARRSRRRPRPVSWASCRRISARGSARSTWVARRPSSICARRAPAPATCGPVPGSVRGFEQVRLGTFDALREKGVAALAVLDHLGAQRFTYIDVSRAAGAGLVLTRARCASIVDSMHPLRYSLDAKHRLT